MSEIPKHFLRIAQLGKAIGLKGDLNLWPISNIEERYKVGSTFFLDSGRELTIDLIRKKSEHFIVRFEGCSSRLDVVSLNNEILYAEPLDDEVLEEGEFFVHDCIDRVVVDQEGMEHGVVVRYHQNLASDLLETDQGDLIPFHFIVSIDEKVHVNVPEGLFFSEEKS